MVATSVSNAIKNFDKVCDNVIQNCEPTIVTRENDNNVVIISQAEYDNMFKKIYKVLN